MNVHADRFPLMDSLRGLAALWVLTFHAAFITGFVTTDTPITPFIDQAGTAAMVFFLVSGFLLYRPFVRARLRDEPMPDLRRYGVARLLRVVPGYWVALTIVALWLGLSQVFDRAPNYYGFAQVYDPSTALGGIPQAWTLCVEMPFYALLPIWALGMRLLPRRLRAASHVRVELIMVAALFAFGVLYKVWLLRRTDPTTLAGVPSFMRLPDYLDAFAVGMALAVLSVWEPGRAALLRTLGLAGRRPVLLWIGALGILWLAGKGLGFNGDPHQHYSKAMFLGRHELQIAAAAALLLAAVVAPPGEGIVGRVLGSRVLIYLGLVSYGFYLYHYAILDELNKRLGLSGGAGARFVAYLALGTLAAVAAATVSYYGLERHVLRLKPRPRRRVPATSGEAIAERAPAKPTPTGPTA